MNKITTAASAALLAALAATTPAFNAQAGTIYWTLMNTIPDDISQGGADIDQYYLALGEVENQLQFNASTYYFYVIQDQGPKGTGKENQNACWAELHRYQNQLNAGTFEWTTTPSGSIVDVKTFTPPIHPQGVLDPDGYQVDNVDSTSRVEDSAEGIDEGDFFGLIVIAELSDSSASKYGTEYIYFILHPAFVENLGTVEDPYNLVVFYPYAMQEGETVFTVPDLGFGIFKPIPEPATGLLLMGGVAVVFLRRRRK